MMEKQGKDSGGHKISKSYLDAMKALQDTCKQLRERVKEMELKNEQMAEKMEYQRMVYDDKIEQLVAKGKKLQADFTVLVNKKKARIQELVTEIKSEIIKNENLLQGNNRLQGEIEGLRMQLKEERTSKKLTLKSLQGNESLLEETKNDLLK